MVGGCVEGVVVVVLQVDAFLVDSVVLAVAVLEPSVVEDQGLEKAEVER